jgi:ribonucleoside-triphosphate reductase
MKIVIKRNGVPVRFDGEKIENAIMKAMIDAHHVDKSVCRLIANNIKEIDKKEITIYEIEDEIYNQLIELNHGDTARYYVEFKAVRTSIRNYKNNVFDQMQDVMDQKSEDIRDNANKSGDKLGTLRAMFSDICCKEFVKERITPKHLAEEQEKLIYEHDRNYRNIPFTNCELVNYRDMMKNGFHVGQTYIHDIKGITTAVALLSQIIAHVTSTTYGGCTVQRLDEGLEPYIEMSYKKHLKIAEEENIPDKDGYAWRRLRKEVHDSCQALEYEISTLTNSRGEVPFITISFGLGESKFAQLFQEEYLKVRLQGFDGLTPVFPKIAFITKRGLNLYPSDPQYYLFKLAIKTSSQRLYPDYLNYEQVVRVTGSFKTSMGCRSFLSSQNLDTNSDGGFNQGVCSVNLVRCAILSNGDEKEFYKHLNHALELSFESLMLRHEMLRKVKAKQNPILFCEGAIARLNPEDTIEELLTAKHSSISIGYVGLHNCMVALYGKSYYESEELLEKGKKIIQYLRSFCDMKKKETGIGFSLYSTPAETLATKFCRSDVKDFGQIEGVTTNGYYENSFHYPSNTDVSPFDKIDFECNFPEIANGGFIQYVEFGDMSKNLKALETVVRYAMERTPYFGVNVRNDVCLNCGYHGLMENIDKTNNDYKCPSCGNTDKTKMSIVVRLCGYISSISERQSVDGKMIEINDRVTHVGER